MLFRSSFVNATVDPFLNAPAQVVRLRLLNGSSMRVYNFGFTNDKEFNLIGTDGGLLNNSLPMNRLLLAPGERGEILLDLQGMEGQTIYLMSNSSEMVNGIYGAATVTGMMGGEIPDYNLNPLNGADFEILQINVVRSGLFILDEGEMLQMDNAYKNRLLKLYFYKDLDVNKEFFVGKEFFIAEGARYLIGKGVITAIIGEEK